MDFVADMDQSMQRNVFIKIKGNSIFSLLYYFYSEENSPIIAIQTFWSLCVWNSFVLLAGYCGDTLGYDTYKSK